MFKSNLIRYSKNPMDIIIYIQCPEIIESPLHDNEYTIIDGILRDVRDILKYSFVVNENRSISYFGTKIDMDYSIEKNTKSLKTVLKYSFIIKNRCIMCGCDITKLLDNMKTEQAFFNEYKNVIRSIVKNTGEKTSEFLSNPKTHLKYADMKRHYIK